MIPSLTHGIFISILICLNIFADFPNPQYLFVLISYFIRNTENSLFLISVLLNLLILIVLPTVCSVLDNVTYVLEKHVYYAVLGQSILHVSGQIG